MKDIRLGFAMCGSFCTHEKALAALAQLCKTYTVTPILSEAAASMDTRFGTAQALRQRVEDLTGQRPVVGIPEAEPIGPKALLDVLVIAPCTGNTLAKLAGGMTDGTVPMAAKAHLRNGRPVVVAMASNDGLSGSAASIAALLNRKGYYFVPFGQDDAQRKPCSLVADFQQIAPAVEAALEGRQLQPILLGSAT